MRQPLGHHDGLGGNGRDGLVPLLADPRRAIQEEGIVCLLCGGLFRQLTNTHLRGHGITSLTYKERFGYNRGRPLMCRALLRLYAERAVRAGLAALIRQRPILSEPELRRRGGMRPIALEERLTRREAWLRARQRGGGGSSGRRPLAGPSLLDQPTLGVLGAAAVDGPRDLDLRRLPRHRFPDPGVGAPGFLPPSLPGHQRERLARRGG